MIEHVVLEHKKTGIQCIKLLEGPYINMIVQFSKIEFEEDYDNDVLHLKYEYQIHEMGDNDMYQIHELEQYLGKFVHQLLAYGLENNDVVYCGGTE